MINFIVKVFKFQALYMLCSCVSIACHVLKDLILPKQVMVIKISRYAMQNCMYISTEKHLRILDKQRIAWLNFSLIHVLLGSW